jgi:hypothetical protein
VPGPRASFARVLRLACREAGDIRALTEETHLLGAPLGRGSFVVAAHALLSLLNAILSAAPSGTNPAEPDRQRSKPKEAANEYRRTGVWHGGAAWNECTVPRLLPHGLLGSLDLPGTIAFRKPNAPLSVALALLARHRAAIVPLDGSGDGTAALARA